jgi:hypothetical protein
MRKFIAQRELLYSGKSETGRRRLLVGISAPYLVKEGAKFKFDPGTTACRIEFEGLPEEAIEVVGADSLQAVQLASNIDPYIKGLEKKYDIYWPTGERYFEE